MSRFFLPTVVCTSIKDDANQLAMVLGEGPADGKTWALAQWTKDGHEYATRNLWITPEWLEAAQQPLERPEWDTEEIIDMDAAIRAQSAIVLWNPESEEEEEPPMPQEGKIVCVPGMDISSLITYWGLEAVPSEDEYEGE